jgi:transposase
MRAERVTLSEREQRRAMALNRVLAGAWTRREAATVLGLSERQVRRLLGAYAACGPQALAHGNRGRRPAHTLPGAVRAQIVALAQGRYAGFNHQHLTEKLNEVEGLPVGRTTVRQVLAAAGLRSPRARRAPKHRQRRERMAQAGLLLQADGSRHRWLGPDGPYLTLIGGIDDATGTVPAALFREQEDAAGYMGWLQQVVLTQGIPHALYVDRHGIFERRRRAPLTLEEELAGGPRPTQFGRVLAELGITAIHAHSPQAKGRIERLWQTFQDRLAGELRLAGARDLAAATRVLATFLPAFNARFGVPPAQPGSAYRPLPPAFAPEQIFCFKYERVVAADNTVPFGAHSLQLLPDATRRSFARARVVVHERLDGSLAVYHRDRCVATRAAPAVAPALRARRVPRPAPAPAAAPPAAGERPPHPWRQSYKTLRPDPGAHVPRTTSRAS